MYYGIGVEDSSEQEENARWFQGGDFTIGIKISIWRHKRSFAFFKSPLSSFKIS
jgi:hypothetical protein